MQAVGVRAVRSEEESAAIHTIVLAFAADPVARWVWKSSQEYLTHMPVFARAFGGRAFLHRTAHCSDGLSGAALWLPPGVHPDEEVLGGIMETTIEEGTRNELVASFEQLADFHPAEPHWYLPLIGVDPALHGRGIGGRLMEHALELCDRSGAPAYLESSNPRNVTLYERHGFEVVGTIQVGSAPPFIPMVRPAF